ncbi:MAG: hypothetical protein AAB668_00010 [Patescibacteria group bacterium]
MKPIPRPSEAHVHAILQDIIVAVWELQDLTRDLQRETQTLNDAIRQTKTSP